MYKSIDLTAGIRFYFFLNPISTSHKIKLYLESGITLPFSKKTRLEPSVISRNSDIVPSTSIPLGIGLKYNRFGISYRHYSAINLLNLRNLRKSELKIGTLALSAAIF